MVSVSELVPVVATVHELWRGEGAWLVSMPGPEKCMGVYNGSRQRSTEAGQQGSTTDVAAAVQEGIVRELPSQQTMADSLG